MTRTRDLNRSRERILAAALKEFAAKGYAGARTRSIAQRARISEQMIFHCFGNKEYLYRTVFNEQLRRISGVLESHESMDLATHLTVGFERAFTDDRDSLRLWQWEALETSRRKLTAENERRSLMQAEVAQLRREKLRGDFPSDLDDGLMLIATLGLRLIPLLLPQLVPLITGLPSDDARFRSKWVGFLRTVSEKFADRGAAAHERVRNESATQSRVGRRSG